MSKNGKKGKIQQKKSGDFFLSVIVLSLVVFGLIMVFSASYYTALNTYGDAYYFLRRHASWAGVGLVAMLFMATFNYKAYKHLSGEIIITIIICLALVVFTPLGKEVNGAIRWLKIGPITFMPGEFAKLAIIIFMAAFLSEDPKRVELRLKDGPIKNFKNSVWPAVFITGIIFAMIAKQPNASTAITVAAIVAAMLFVAGLSYKLIIFLGGSGAAMIIAYVLSDTYRLKRITSFLDPFSDMLGSGYQVCQSLMALGSGGLFGVGLGKSMQKTLYLPEPQNDFILAIIGEELGFIGCMLLFAAYLFLIWRGIHIALNAPDYFGMLLASGITAMIGIQVVFNIAVVTSSMPPTGVILPFVSYGGNALLMFMASVGILLNISRQSAK